MKVFYILTLTLFNVLGINAQNKEFLSAESCPFKLGESLAVTNAEDNFFTAKVSPDGTKLLVTKRAYQGVYIIDLKNYNQITVITDEQRAGYRANWTGVNNEISFKSRKLSKGRQLVYYNIAKKTLNLANPNLKSASNSGERKKEITVKFNLKRRMVEATDGGKTWDITKEPGVYYGCLISPDKTKVLIHENDGKMYVYALDGSGLLHQLGQGICENWTPDSKYLIYFIDIDDGEKTINSDLYICNNTGSQRWQLTNTSDKIEMWPHLSVNGSDLTYYDEKSNRIFITTLIKTR